MCKKCEVVAALLETLAATDSGAPKFGRLYADVALAIFESRKDERDDSTLADAIFARTAGEKVQTIFRAQQLAETLENLSGAVSRILSSIGREHVEDEMKAKGGNLMVLDLTDEDDGDDDDSEHAHPKRRAAKPSATQPVAGTTTDEIIHALLHPNG